MSILSLLMNLMHPWWIKVLIKSIKQKSYWHLGSYNSHKTLLLKNVTDFLIIFNSFQLLQKHEIFKSVEFK